ncbi:hypothetical protein UT300009_30830 [Paraclostridium bifermentans]
MLKGLKEKRNQLVGELEVMITSIEGETRALNQDELEKFDAKKKEIEQIDATIARVEETRFNKMNKEEKKVETEKRSKDEMEKRALDAFFRHETLDSEMRTMLTTSGDNQATIPLTIAEGILKRLEEMCPILEKGKRFSSKGTLRLIEETSYGAGALTEENQAFHDEDAVLNHIDLNSYKITAMTKATFELLANSSVDLNAYLTDVIVRRLAKEINKTFLVGTGTKQAEGLINGKQTVEIGSKVSYDDVVKMVTSMHPDYLNGASFIMNRKTFTAYALLADGNGHKYVQSGVVNGKFTYTLAGVPIIIDNNMPDIAGSAKPVILANIQECYAINLLQDIVVRRLDQVEFTNGVEVFAGYLMADGRIVNQDAIKVAVVGTGSASKASK